MVAESTLRNIQRNLERTEELQNQITSGSRLRKPSDDPIGIAHAISFEESLEQSGQFIRNIDQATGWLNDTDSTLGSVTQLLQRARELAVRGANGTLSADDRLAAKAEIDQINGQALELSNAKHGTRYLFAGTRTNQPAYSSATPSGYQGNTQAIERDIAPGIAVGINVTGPSAFDAVFDGLNNLSTSLGANDTVGIRSSLDDLQAALDKVLTARAQVGAKTNRLEFARGRLEEVRVNLSDLLSRVKDVDMAEAITNFSVQENVYQASLKAASKALQPSLLDYLR